MDTGKPKMAFCLNTLGDPQDECESNPHHCVWGTKEKNTSGGFGGMVVK